MQLMMIPMPASVVRKYATAIFMGKGKVGAHMRELEGISCAVSLN
jgi:hypothetical protein